MTLSSVLHRLGQKERDVREQGLGEDLPADTPRADLDFASNAELDDEAALAAEDTAEVARLAAVIEERRSEGEAMASGQPARTWTPPVTPELAASTRDARARGVSILPVADGVQIELGFLLDERGEEPEPLAIAAEPPLEPEPDPSQSSQLRSRLRRRP